MKAFVRAEITYALHKAREAVAFDGDHSYAEALEAYRECVIGLEKVLAKANENWLLEQPSSNLRTEGLSAEPILEESSLQKIIELRNTYIQRVDLPYMNKLLANLPPHVIAVYNGSGFGERAFNSGLYGAISAELAEDETSLLASYEQFWEAVIVDDPGVLDWPESPPSNSDHRSFWLMRLLGKSMRSGGFLTSELYIPRHVWYQAGAKFVAIEAKFTACETIHLALKRFSDVDVYNTKVLTQLLEEFENVADSVRLQLGKKLKYVEMEQRKQDMTSGSLDGASTTGSTQSTGTRLLNWGSKLSRGLSTLGRKAEKVADLSLYIELLHRLFSNAQILEEYMNHYEGKISADIQAMYSVEGQTLERLKRISNFFQTVICAFVVRDLEILLDRYQRKMSQIATLPT
ncbi:hypothetical protein HDU96_005306 [Phlyctochytrium bullatum]|nr:hypothetical protein HDU96_005306 [Phlyctochytrium bullatum]